MPCIHFASVDYRRKRDGGCTLGDLDIDGVLVDFPLICRLTDRNLLRTNISSCSELKPEAIVDRVQAACRDRDLWQG